MDMTVRKEGEGSVHCSGALQFTVTCRKKTPLRENPSKWRTEENIARGALRFGVNSLQSNGVLDYFIFTLTKSHQINSEIREVRLYF